MKKLLYFLIPIIASCETAVDLDVPLEEPRLVVNSLFTNDTSWYISVSESQHILDNAPLKEVSDATIEIYDASGLIEKVTSVPGSPGDYLPTTKPRTGVQYTIKVSDNKHGSITAVNTIPEAIKISSIDTARIVIEGNPYFVVSLKFKDQEAIKNYYEIHFSSLQYEYITDYPDTTVIDSTIVEEPFYFELKDAGLEDNWEMYSLYFTDKVFDGKEYVLKAYFHESLLNQYVHYGTEYSYRGPVFSLAFHFHTLSEAYYLYKTSLSKSNRTKGDPFAQPVQVYNNIQNGFGIFAGYSTYADTIAIK